MALVTGASSGIGQAFAVALGARGSDLVVVARRRDRLEDLAGRLRETSRVSVETLVADLTDADDLAKVEDRLRDPSRPVDLLVNNAGVGGHGPFAELPIEDEDRRIRLNVLAPVHLTSAALPGMIERRRGGVVNVSSVASVQPLPFVATYAATKAYLTSFSEALHEEVRRRGVVVLALMPGFTHTEFHGRSGLPGMVIPESLWMKPDQVVASALKALARGRASHVPGLMNRAMATLSRLTPRVASRRVVGRATRS